MVSVLYSAGGHLEHVEMKRLNRGSYSGNGSSLDLGMAHALSCWHPGATSGGGNLGVDLGGIV